MDAAAEYAASKIQPFSIFIEKGLFIGEEVGDGLTAKTPRRQGKQVNIQEFLRYIDR